MIDTLAPGRSRRVPGHAGPIRADETFGLAVTDDRRRQAEAVPEIPWVPRFRSAAPTGGGPVEAFWISLVVIFVAELGDKSQLMAMTFATRFRSWPIIAGITFATAVVHLFSVAIGGVAGDLLPTSLVAVVAGVAFLGFAAWTLRGDTLSTNEVRKARTTTRSALIAVTAAFFLSELGDKTMLATITLATRHDWLGTWLGSTIGMVAADALAIAVGLLLGRHLPERVIRYGAAAAFAAFGVALLVEGIS